MLVDRKLPTTGSFRCLQEAAGFCVEVMPSSTSVKTSLVCNQPATSTSETQVPQSSDSHYPLLYKLISVDSSSASFGHLRLSPPPKLEAMQPESGSLEETEAQSHRLYRKSVLWNLPPQSASPVEESPSYSAAPSLRMKLNIVKVSKP
ncbi:unnamed protein product [Protopolystoma xenopodis]|uniref:Uncharacterized protein n=1 Tax=Protopolystoma xenopodis TaxID=117903 RepID=A0A3S5AEK0_9PLAT|nr:unnamed protein product [Protopolystoma xenopodis]